MDDREECTHISLLVTFDPPKEVEISLMAFHTEPENAQISLQVIYE